VKGYLAGALVFAISICAGAQQPDPVGPKSEAEKLGYAGNQRLLVIQAEDLGMAHSIDRASFEALEKGWVTSAGVLVPGPWFPEVLRWSRNHPNADLGVRLDLNADWSSYRWRPVSGLQKGSGLTDPGGYLSSNSVAVAQHGTPAEVEGELRAQIDITSPRGQTGRSHGVEVPQVYKFRYLVDQGGEQVTELNGSGTWPQSNVWAVGKLTAT
jgi:hypothetical protein